MKTYKLIIFDLDGTLADTSKGIYECHKFANVSMGREEPTMEDLKGVIGGSLLKIYTDRFGYSENDAKIAVRNYREHYAKVGYKDSVLYDGMKESLMYLKEQGYKIAVATLKAEDLAIELFKELGIYQYFDIVHGMDREDTRTKSSIINMCLCESGIDASNAVLVGDSINDAKGAKESSVGFVGALYGFGFKFEEDLKEYDCIAIIKMPKDLTKIF